MSEDKKKKQREIGCRWTRQYANIFSDMRMVKFQRVSGEKYWQFLGYYYDLSTLSIYYHGHLRQIVAAEGEGIHELLADYLNIDITEAEDFLRALIRSDLAVYVDFDKPFEKYVDENNVERDGAPIPDSNGNSLVFPLIAASQGSQTESYRVQGIRNKKKLDKEKTKKLVEVISNSSKKAENPGFNQFKDSSKQWDLPEFKDKTKSPQKANTKPSGGARTTMDIARDRKISERWNELVVEFTLPVLNEYCKELDRQSSDIKGDKAVTFLRGLYAKNMGLG